MYKNDMLARLIAQAEGAGADLITLRAIVEEATDNGAARALDRLGLGDSVAHDDLNELRKLLGAWHDAKKSAWKAGLGWIIRGVSALLLIGIAAKLGLGEMLA